MAEPGTTAIADPPRATYRLQLHRDFTFRDALAIVDYLSALGISHVYASPVLAARPGSRHGYDIVDHNRLNPELGSAEEFDALIASLRAHGMGLLLDIVPNHMGVGGKDNAWWLDVLEWGEASPYASFFDIDWTSGRRGLAGKVLIPVLGDQYGKILKSGEIKLAFDAAEGRFSAWYHDHRLPIDPRHYRQILDPLADTECDPLRALVQACRALAEMTDAGAAYRQASSLKRRLADAAAGDRDAAALLAGAADRLNGVACDLASWMPLHQLIEQQSYRPAYWRVAADEINYRRFFNINDLAGIRVERRAVFDATHNLVCSLVAEGKAQGLRIDHIDGLHDPREYCERLRACTRRPAHLVVEKILAAHERLPGDWPIVGTTGYDNLNLINGLFVDPSGEGRLDRFYHRYTRRDAPFDRVLYESKKRIMRFNLASEMNVLASELHRLAAACLSTRDFTLRGMLEALEEVIAHLPVYRTYVTPQGASEQDRRFIDWAIARSKRHSQAADTSVFDFIQSVLTGDLARQADYELESVLRVAMRAQQVSGPVTAKGMEDTAFYRYFRLLSLNEVGGDPRRFGVSPAAFHRANRQRLARWPDDMLASSTHDTKRGEDARARLNLLSEIPGRWASEVIAWTRINRTRHTEVDDAPAPEPNHEYLFYQSLIGAWPLDLDGTDAAAMPAFAARIAAFMQKAVREGKERSSWGNPNAAYEEAVERFVHAALQVSSTNGFPAAFVQFLHRYIARFGAINSLAQTLLKLTVPGVPDTYQGGELWDLSLVDPDNRRPVDYATRRRLLAELQAGLRGTDHNAEARAHFLGEVAARWQDGREKLLLITEVLRLRRQHADLFARGAYAPIRADGERANHVCAFVRHRDRAAIVTIVPRLSAKLAASADERADHDPWRGTVLRLPAGRWSELFSGRDFEAGPQPVREVLRHFPVALLERVA